MPSGTTQTLCGAVEVNYEKPARIVGSWSHLKWITPQMLCCI